MNGWTGRDGLRLGGEGVKGAALGVELGRDVTDKGDGVIAFLRREKSEGGEGAVHKSGGLHKHVWIKAAWFVQGCSVSWEDTYRTVRPGAGGRARCGPFLSSKMVR